MIDRRLVDRLVTFRSETAPVLSVYLAIGLGSGATRSAESRLHSVLKPVRALVEGRELDHEARESLRTDSERILEAGARLGVMEGRALAVFACAGDGLYEEVVLPRLLRDRAVVDATAYVRPMLAILDESHRYCAVVVDREHAWLYEFWMGQLEAATTEHGRGVRKRDFGGWHGLEEYQVRNRAQELTRRHFRETAQAIEDMMRRTGAELLIVGGHKETVAELLPFLPRGLSARLAGTFVIDPHTMSPGKVREQADAVVQRYERDEEERLVAQAFERAATGSGATGIEWCLEAVNEQAVQLLLVHDDTMSPGLACDNCGWLGRDNTPGILDAGTCPVCRHTTRRTPDVIDEMAAAVIEASGSVEHVYAETDLAKEVLAAFLRFPVARPSP